MLVTPFRGSPGVVKEVTGEQVDAQELGGPRVHSKNGVCQFVAEDEHAAAELVRDLLAHLPQHAGQEPPRTVPVGPGAVRRLDSPPEHASANANTAAAAPSRAMNRRRSIA